MAITYTKPRTYGYTASTGDMTSEQYRAAREANAAHPIICLKHYAGEVTHVGQVAGTVGRDVRIMSDVWAVAVFAKIATPEGMKEVKVGLFDGPDADGQWADVVADAPPALVAQAEAADKAKADAIEAAKRTAAIKAANEHDKAAVLNDFGKGDRVRVYKGRKVPKGTEGEIIWEGHGNYGPRVGVKDDEGTVHWTARSNVERADATELAILANGDWSALRCELERKADAKREAARKAAPVKGTRVRTACGHTGKVFWVAGDGSRVGVRVGKGREDVVWANTNTVAAA